MKILFYVEASNSLGHITRSILVTEEILKRCPGADIEFILRSDFSRPFDDRGLKVIRFPTNVGSGIPQGGCLDESYSKPLCDIIDREKPDAIVWDKFYSPIIIMYPFINHIYVLRRTDQIDTFFHSDYLSRFNLTLSPHAREDFALYENNFKRVLDNVNFIGPIVKEPKKRCMGGKFKILAVCGGGPILDSFVDSSVNVFNMVDNKIPGLEYTLITGPFYEHFLELKKRYSDRFKIIDYTDDIMQILSSTHLAISTAGYNSVFELVVSHTPSIMVTNPRHNDDQNQIGYEMKAGRLAFVFDDFDVPSIYEKIISCYNHRVELQKIQTKLKNINLDTGNSRAADMIISLFNRQLM